MHNLPFEKKVTAIKALCDGNAIRATARIAGAHRDTVMRLGRDVGEGYSRLHDELFRGLRCNFLEVDEAWAFIGKKQAHVLPNDPPEFGDQYSYVALDADHKTIVSYLVGKRNNDSTVTFALDLRGRVLGTPQITSDGFQPYVKAVAIAFGRSVDYAQLIKLYQATCSVETARRYSPNRVADQTIEIVFGDPDLGRVSTSYVERQNLTLRMMARRFTRLTSGFSKVLRNHTAAMDLYVGWYNLVRVHDTLGKTPAMASGVTKKPWTPEQFVKECLSRNDRQHPPIRAGSQRYAEVICKWGVCDVVEER